MFSGELKHHVYKWLLALTLLSSAIFTSPVLAEPLNGSACIVWMKNVGELAQNYKQFREHLLRPSYGPYVAGSPYLYAHVNRWVTFSNDVGGVDAYDLKELIHKNGIAKRGKLPKDRRKYNDLAPWFRVIIAHCNSKKNYISPKVFHGQAGYYRIYSNEDICSINPKIEIYGNNDHNYERLPSYLPNNQAQIREELKHNFYVGWDYKAKYLTNPPILQSHTGQLSEHLKKLMINQCGLLPSRVEIKMLHPISGQPAQIIMSKRGKKPALNWEQRLQRANRGLYEFPIPAFEVLYSGSLQLKDIRQDKTVPVNIYTDLHYLIADDDLVERAEYVIKFRQKIVEAQRKTARRRAIEERRRRNVVYADQINTAFLEGVVQGLTLHFIDEAYCDVWSKTAAKQSGCYQSYNQSLSKMKKEFGDAYAFGNILGMLFTPTGLLLPEKYKDSPRDIAILEASEGILMGIGEAGFYSDVDVETVTVNAITGAAIGYGLGGIKAK